MMGAQRVQAGDLILVKTPGFWFTLGRWLTGNPYDHIAVVGRNGQTVNVAKPKVVLVPVERILTRKRAPLILRPAWQNDEQRERFVDWMEALADRPYDTSRALRLLVRILLKRYFGWTVALKRPALEQRRWICTDAILTALQRQIPTWSEIEQLPLDWVQLGCSTTNDFIRLSTELPKLLSAFQS